MSKRNFRAFSLLCTVSALALTLVGARAQEPAVSAQEPAAAAPVESPAVAPTDRVEASAPAVQSTPDVTGTTPAQSAPAQPAPSQSASAAPAPEAPAPAAAAEPQALSPAASAIKDFFAAIEAQPMPRDVAGKAVREDMKAIGAYYAARDFAPVWSNNGAWAPSAASAIERLRKANEDALDAAAWRVPALETGDPARLAAADIALSQATAAYGRQASGGRVKPSAISGLITAKPETAAHADILSKVSAAGGNAGDTLLGFNPQHPGYRALRAKLADIRGAKPAPQETPVAIAPGPVLKIGMSDQRVPLIRARFALTPNEPNADPLVYDTRVAGAVAAFQRSKGMAANGQLTPQTVNALSGNSSGGASPAEAEIISNMERWRWLPRDLGKMHVFVNVPEFMVRVLKDGQQIHETKVIVGATKTPSPIFSHKMQYLIVNPSWHVPPSIIKESGGAERMAAKGFEVRQTRWGVAVRQPPGPKNALGYIKFLFPNDHAVYLHDTPGRHLFAASMRAMSHGCIRVHEPFKLAEVLLSTEAGWSERRLKGMIGSGERQINLPQHLPIHIAYFTTFVDDNGHLQQRPDIYGHSRKLVAALGIK